MKAMVFAAGIGSRLKELTAAMPKCLVPLADGSTMLDHVVERLKKAGVDQIVMNLHHVPELIQAHVKKKQRYGIEIAFTTETILLGTGGGLKNAKWFFDEKDFFVHNSDVFSDVDLIKLYTHHRALRACATLAVMQRPTSRPLLFTKERSLAGWVVGQDAQELVEGKTPEFRVGFSGVQVLSPQIFEYMEALSGSFSTIAAFMAAARDGKHVAAFDMTDNFWIDMGTPERLAELNKYLGAK